MNDTQHSSPSGPTHAPRILVTGAARRVGAEIARCLHAAGARVVLHYRSSAGEAEALAASLNALRADSAFTVRGDLARFGAAEDIAAQERARRAAAGRASTMLMGGAADDQTLGGGGQPAAQAPTATKVLLGG